MTPDMTAQPSRAHRHTLSHVSPVVKITLPYTTITTHRQWF